LINVLVDTKLLARRSITFSVEAVKNVALVLSAIIYDRDFFWQIFNHSNLGYFSQRDDGLVKRFSIKYLFAVHTLWQKKNRI